MLYESSFESGNGEPGLLTLRNEREDIRNVGSYCSTADTQYVNIQCWSHHLDSDCDRLPVGGIWTHPIHHSHVAMVL